MRKTITTTVMRQISSHIAPPATRADVVGRRGAKRVRRMVAGSLTMLLLAASTALACPTCSNVIKDDPVAAAFSWTTLFLIAVPLSLFGSIGGWIVLTYRRAARAGVDLVMPEGAWVHASAEKESER